MVDRFVPGSCRAYAFLLATLALALPGQAVDREGDLASLDLEALMQIEVTTAAKRARSIRETPAAVSVITAEDIRRSGALSLPELLRGVPGLHVAQLDATHWSVSSRGFADEFSNKLLVMIDGRSIYAPIFSGVLWSEHDVMLEDIERIEVVRGPGGALWGANAVNGVINIITRSSEETQGLAVSAQSGSYERLTTSVRYGHEILDSLHGRAYIKLARRDDFPSVDSGTSDENWESLRTGGRFDWRPTERDLVTLSGDFFQGTVDKILAAGPAADEVNRGANLLFRMSRTFSDTADVSLRFWWDRTDRDVTVVEELRDTFDLEFQHGFEPLPRNHFVWGGGYRSTQDDIEGTQAIDFTVDSRRDEVFSLFVQDEIAVLPNRLALTLGTKVEHNDYTGWEIQPSGRILYAPTEEHTLWGAVSHAVRTPSRVEDDIIFFRPIGPTTFERSSGSRDVDSEDLTAYELGFRGALHPRVNLDVAAYYNDYARLRTAEFLLAVPGPFPGTTLNLHEIDNKMSGSGHGVEIATEVQLLDSLRLTGTYTYTRLVLERDGDSTDLDAEDIEDHAPRHQFGLRSHLDLPRDFSLDTSLFWVDRLSDGRTDVDAYTRLDTRLAWEPMPGLELSIVGLNLIEEHQEFADGLVTQASLVPRSVYGSLRWEFE